MLRGVILIVFLLGLAALVAPFVISSLWIDAHGITIPGKVYSKREEVAVRHSGWKRSAAATVEYYPPDEAGVEFYTVQLDPETYDALRVGQTVQLHYLRREDVPAVPLSKFLLELHALPQTRLANRRALAGLERFLEGDATFVAAAIGVIALLLVLWRIARKAAFGWALGACAVVSFALMMIHDFPRPTPRPSVDVRQGSGRVKSVDRINRLFDGQRSRGIDADQPIDVVGVEFIPEERTERVMAVDLIDSGSIAGLKENMQVPIEYESRSPRTAYIRGAKRNFASANLAGIGVEGALWIGVLVALITGMRFMGRAFTRLIQRRIGQ
jgi:hypothetical protein